MLKILMQNLYLILILNFIVLIHELGHYLCAKIFKVHIDMCFIGIGSPLFEFKDSSGTLWVFGVIPLGGYISLLEPDIDSKKGTGALHPLKNCLIALSGPFLNFLLFCIGYFLVFFNLNYNTNIDYTTESSAIILSKSEVDFLNDKSEFLEVFKPDYKNCYSLLILRIKNVFSNLSHARLLGPIKIMMGLKKALNKNALSTLYCLSNLSLFFGLFNLIPIYILDGGMIIMYLYIYISKRTLSERSTLILMYCSIILISSILCYILFYEIYPILIGYWSNR